jgi:DNA-binding transcriptional ArsR family regulator
MESEEVVPILAALAQETRLDVFRLLVEAGPRGLPAGEIARSLGIAAPTLSFHLRAMLHAGLVTSQRSGRLLFYAPSFDRLTQVVAFLTENCCAGSDGKRAPTARRISRSRAAS